MAGNVSLPAIHGLKARQPKGVNLHGKHDG